MIFISKARYRVFPLREDCHRHTFRFFMLRSILYSPDVILSFSRTFLFAIVTSFFLISRSGQAAYFSFLCEPEGGKVVEAKYHGHSKYFTISCFGIWLLSLSLSLSLSLFLVLVLLSFFPTCIFCRTDNKKYIHAKLIWYLYPHSYPLSLNVFCSHEIVLTLHDHPDNAVISSGIGIEVKVATDLTIFQRRQNLLCYRVTRIKINSYKNKKKMWRMASIASTDFLWLNISRFPRVTVIPLNRMRVKRE